MQHLKAGPQTSLMNPKANYLSYFGANELVDRIKAYWEKRGKFPAVWAEPVPQTVTGEDLYQVRSNMAGGRAL